MENDDNKAKEKKCDISSQEAKYDIKRDDSRIRRHEKWVEMATMYISCGRQDKALEMMEKIDDDNQSVACKSASYHAPMKEQHEQQEKQAAFATIHHESRNLADVPLEVITIATSDNIDHVNVTDICLHDSHKKIINLVLLSLPAYPLNGSSTI
ncbi:hypothetical protein MHU86_20693 [Fragilaria crotonensis]|nr:hypothetical protein MHU86_20693 [Fragilaria crotonensis]